VCYPAFAVGRLFSPQTYLGMSTTEFCGIVYSSY
jgi:hypothetical protein